MTGYDDGNVFAKIIAGKIPAKKLFENEHALSFHDIAPKAPVHVLVIPKGPYVTADQFYANASESEIVAFARALAESVKLSGVAESGYRLISNNRGNGHQEMPHFHVHILGGAKLGKMLDETRG